jgi:transcriptional regulator with XRE-family HTH domain
MTVPFSEKLTFVLKVLSMSRARLAAELGIDKSVVARWASGATVPSGHNLSQLSTLLAQTIPGFTALDWDRDMEGLADLLGVGPVRPAAAPAVNSPPVLALPLIDQIVATTALRGGAYEGFYRSTRPYAANPGRFIHDHSLVRLDRDGLLRFKMATGGVFVEGWILPVQTQLYLIGTEFTGGSLTFAILHGVNTVKADVLDGITLTSNLDVGRTLAAGAVIYHRIGDLTYDRGADDARLADLGAVNPVAPEGSIPEDLRRHLSRDLSGLGPTFGVDGVLRLPIIHSLSRGPQPDLP